MGTVAHLLIGCMKKFWKIYKTLIIYCYTMYNIHSCTLQLGIWGLPGWFGSSPRGRCPFREGCQKNLVKSLVFCHPGGEPDFNFQKNNIEDFGISVTHYSCQKGQPGSVVQD